MRIKLLEKAGQHTEICTACAWSNGELYTCSDDMNILKWSQEGEMRGTYLSPDVWGLFTYLCAPSLLRINLLAHW